MNLMPNFFNQKKFLIILVILLPLLVVYLIKIFNLFPLPNLNREVKIATPTAIPKSQVVQAGPYVCPSVREFCQKGADITQDGEYMGFGADLAMGTSIYSAFAGTLSSVSSTLGPAQNNEQITTVYLDNPQRGLRAVYYFIGLVPENKAVKAGEKIGTVGEKMVYFESSLVFTLIRNYPPGEKIRVTNSDFK